MTQQRPDLDNCRGATIVEYALTVGILLVGIAGSVAFLDDSIRNFMVQEDPDVAVDLGPCTGSLSADYGRGCL